MHNLLYLFGLTLILIWTVVYFGFSTLTGDGIHILLIIAFIAILIRILKYNK